MRPMKTFGLAAIAALASMAMLAAGTASAGNTTLCTAHQEPCAVANQRDTVSMALTAGTVSRLLSSLSTVLCLGTSLVATVEGSLLQNPLPLNVVLAFTNCGTNAAHNNCTKTVLEQPLMVLLRTALNLGTLSGTAGKPGKTNLECTVFGILIDCDYSLEKLAFPVEGAGHTAGAGRGMATANGTPLPLIEALRGICPENATLDGLLEPTAANGNAYVMT